MIVAMRRWVAVVVVVLLPAGCGEEAPPDVATSERLVTTTVLDWHRLQAAHDGEAACALLTEKQRTVIVDSRAAIMRAVGEPPTEDCAEAIARGPSSAQFQELMLNTEVDAVRVEGEQATATAHTTATIRGVPRRTPPARIGLRWVDGRWLIG